MVTGLGAVTPIGNDAPSTWRAAVAGESGIDFIRSFDASEFPVRDRRRGQGLRPEHGRLAEGGAEARPQRPARARRRRARRSPTRGSTAPTTPDRVGILFGTAIGGFLGDHGAGGGAARARPRPRLADLHPERARRRGERPARDLARLPRPELRAGLRVRDRLARRRRGRRADQARRRRRGARGRRRGVHAPADPRRLLRDARARRRGRASAARVAAVRRDARRLRDGRGRVRARARGARGGAASAARRSTPRSSATARRTTRTTSRSPIPSRSASPR